MDLVKVMEQFPDQETCIEHLEGIRWGDKPQCLKCEGFSVARKNENGLGRIGRWCCRDCDASFKVTREDNLCWHENTASEVVLDNITNRKC